MLRDGLNFESHRVGDVYRTLARTVSETDIMIRRGDRPGKEVSL